MGQIETCVQLLDNDPNCGLDLCQQLNRFLRDLTKDPLLACLQESLSVTTGDGVVTIIRTTESLASCVPVTKNLPLKTQTEVPGC